MSSPGRKALPRNEITKVTCIRAATRQRIAAVSTLGTISTALFAMATLYVLLAMVAIRSVDDVIQAKPILPAHPKTNIGMVQRGKGLRLLQNGP
jgi:hypothetical protein